MSEINLTAEHSLQIIKSLQEGDIEELFLLISEYFEINNIVFAKEKLKPIEMHCISILDD